MFKDLLDSAPVAVLVSRVSDGKLLYANDALAAMLGLPLDQLVGSKTPDFYHDPADRQQVVDALGAGGKVQDIEIHAKKADGTLFWSKTSFEPIVFDGEPAIFAGAVDITSQKQAEQDVRQARDRLEEALEAMSEGFVLFDADDRLVQCNSRFREMFADAADVIDTHPTFEEWARTCAERGLIAGAIGREEDWLADRMRQHHEYAEPTEHKLSNDGWVRITEYETKSGGTAGLRLDITEQKRAEEITRNAEAKFAGILAITPQAIISVGENQAITLFNSGAEKIFGYAAEEILGRPLEILMPARFRNAHGKLVKIFSDSGEVSRLMGERAEIVGLRKDGSEFPAEACISLLDLDGTKVLTALLQDITTRQQREEQLRQAQKMHAIGQLTGGVAHDFNNLLTAIVGNLELLEDQIDKDPDIRQLLEVAQKAAFRGADLTHRLLAFSRRQTLNPRTLDINKTIASTTGFMQRTLTSDVELQTVLAGGLWRAEIDESQLENALINLGINARDAMPDGGKLTIETANAHLDQAYADSHDEVKAGQYVMVAVTDTGTGMSPEVLEKAFDPFFTTKDVGKGTGLGLSMIYGFVKQSGGHLKLYSEEDQGTTVKLYLPRAKDDGKNQRTVQTPLRIQPSEGETILVVEDDPDVLAYIVTALQTLDYNVVAAGDGPSALAALGQFTHLDLLLTDVVLPGGMNGQQVAERVRAHFPESKVLFTSGYTENAIVHQGRLEKDAVLLAKPYTKATLARKVREILGSANE